MSLKKLLEKAALSRRNLLKGMGVVATTAALAGCSDSDSDDFSPVANGQSDLQFQQADRYAFNTGPFNCGSKCVHKFHVKNERIVAMTSAGDLPRNESASDEYGSTTIGEPMQFRSCVRGYSYIQRVYQPDRLKYPLLQTGEKGNLNTFKRISWDEAFKRIGDAMKAAFDKAPTLGYVPVLDRMNFVAGAAKEKGLTYLAGRSNASNGNSEAAKLDSVGTTMVRNSKADNLNSRFTLLWGADPTRHSNHENGAYWMYTQAKERGVKVVTISPVCTDQAAMYSNSVEVNLPAFTHSTISGGGKVIIPGWVPIRPGTDGALALAMCYVIYRRGLYSESYLTQSSGRKCFGFYKGDSVQSIAKDKSGNFQFAFPKDTTVNGVSYTKGQKFNGKTFTVPVGESFEEILVNLECDVANGGWAKTTFSAPALNDNATDGVNKAQNYQEVLEYAAKLTGVKSAVIEALAYEFAHDVSKIDAGCGPQRQYAGAEWVLVLIALTVMCGHVEEKGGGLPMGMGSFPDNSFFLDPKNPTGTTTTGFTYNIPDDKTTDSYIDIMDQNLAEIILTGRDGRTAAQFQSDNGLTVDPVKTPNIATLTGVEIDVYTMSSSNRMITHPNVNKTIEAYRKIKTVVVCDQVMTPSAAFADIVLPAATHLEDVGGIGGQGEVKILKQNVLRKTMYESKRQGEINSLYLRACAQAVGTTLPKEYAKPADLDMIEASKKTFAGFASSKMYNDAVGTPAVIPSWEEFAKTGAVHIVGPADKPVMGLKHLYKPGVDIETSTGYINFWSPFWGVARRDALATLSGGSKYAAGDYTAGWRVTAPDYVPVREGYEKFFANGNVHDTFTGYNSPHSGRNYKLQFMTNKARNRAHTCQDNVAIIKDQFEQKAYMNPLDAAERFIKDGDYVYVYNDRGCTKIRAAVTHYITPGVISVEHGAWYRASTDPKEQVKIWISTGYDTDAVEKTVPVDVGGCENLLTDDRFVYDVLFINQTAGLHAGPVEVSLTKPE